MNRIVWADALKGILIVLVVLGHSLQAVMYKMGMSFTEDYLWNLIYSFHMPAFIAVSGYLAYGKNIVGGGSNSWFKTSVRRFRQLMIPYLLWSVALFFVNHNVEHYYECLLYPQKSLWFLWALFFIVIIFNAVESFARRIKMKHEVSMGISWLALVGLMFVMPDAKMFGVEYVAYYFFYYLMGYYLNKYSEKLIIKNGFVLAVVGLLWFGLGSIYSTQGLPHQLSFIPVIPSSILYYLYRVSTALLAILFFFSLAMKIFGENRGMTYWIVQLGKVSLGIYAVHMVIRFRLVDGLTIAFPQLSYWPMMALTFCVLIPVSYGLVYLLGRWDVTASLLLGKLKK